MASTSLGGVAAVSLMSDEAKGDALEDFMTEDLNAAVAWAVSLAPGRANRAMKTGMDEEIIFACLIHDVVQTLIKVDHGWWGAQMFEPYVSPKVAYALRYHQALRFYADEANGYEYPDLYRRTFGTDYTPEPYIERTYQMVRKDKRYIFPRLVTVNDL